MNPACSVKSLPEGLVSRRPPFQRIEYYFGLLLAVFGLIFLFTLPPVQIPDEGAHFLRAYDVAQGNLMPTQTSEGWAGTTVPVELLPIILQPTRLWNHPEERWTQHDFDELLKLRFMGAESPATLAQVSIYTFLPYLPQAAGIWVASQLHLPPLPLFYAARLGSLLFGVLCVVLAIRLTPIGKLLFGAVALLPLTVQQIASASVDGPTIGVTLLVVAALLRAALAPPSLPLRTSGYVLLLILMFATAMTKFPYALLVFLYFGAAPEQAGSRRRYWAIGALVLAVTAAGLATSAALTRPYILDAHHLSGVPISKSGQVHFILTHPKQFLWIFLNNIAHFGCFWVISLFALGSMDALLNPFTGFVYLFFLAFLAMADRRRGELPRRLWLAGSVVSLLSTATILTALYVWWNPPASNMIEGPQGRYFIPLMPLFFLLLRNLGFQVHADERFLTRMTLAVTTVFLTYAWAVLMNRYYFREPPVLLAPPMLLSLSVAALLLFWAWCRWNMANATRDDAVSYPSHPDAASRPAA